MMKVVFVLLNRLDITLSDNLNQQNGAIKAQTLNLTANALNSLTKKCHFGG